MRYQFWTETIDKALEMAENSLKFEEEFFRGWDKLGGKGGFVDHFSGPNA